MTGFDINYYNLFKQFGEKVEGDIFFRALRQYARARCISTSKMIEDIVNQSAKDSLGRERLTFFSKSDNCYIPKPPFSSQIILVGTSIELAIYCNALKKRNCSIKLSLYIVPSKEEDSFSEKYLRPFNPQRFYSSKTLNESIFLENEADDNYCKGKIDVFYFPSVYKIEKYGIIIEELKKLSPFLDSEFRKRAYYFHLYSDDFNKEGEEIYSYEIPYLMIKINYWNRWGILYRMAALKSSLGYKGNSHDILVIGGGMELINALPYIVCAHFPLKGVLRVFISEEQENKYLPFTRKIELLIEQGLVEIVYIDFSKDILPLFNSPCIFVDGKDETELINLEKTAMNIIDKYGLGKAHIFIIHQEEVVTPMALASVIPDNGNTVLNSSQEFVSMYGGLNSNSYEKNANAVCAFLLLKGKPLSELISPQLSDSKDNRFNAADDINHFFVYSNLSNVLESYSLTKAKDNQLLKKMTDLLFPVSPLSGEMLYRQITSLYGTECLLHDMARREHNCWMARTLIFLQDPSIKKDCLVSFEKLEKTTMDALISLPIAEAYKKDLVFSDYLFVIAYLSVINQKMS